MEKWKETKLGDFIELQRGHDLTESERELGDIPVIGSAGINGYHNVSKYNAPGVTIGRSGASIGVATYVETKYWPHNACLFVKNFKGNNPKFVYYLLKIYDFERLNSGSAQPSLNRNYLYPIKLNIPPLPIQQKIASILSSYDELIENNKQRIKLLEEMAEEIYKEWFVRLRFPGYEDTKMVDGLPEGWERKPIDEFLSFSMSKAKLKKFNNTKTYIATADVTDINITGQGEIIDWENKPSRAQLVPELNSVFFARMSNTYKVLVFSKTNKELIDELALTSGFLGLKALNEETLPYLFWLIKSEPFHNYKDVFANGATQVSLTNEGFHNIKLVEPSLKIIEKFGEITSSFLNEIITLNKKNQLLQETRDLLLPRLISGKLSVEHLLEEEVLGMVAEPRGEYK
jgi:type I restriction enzyme S subunit